MTSDSSNLVQKVSRFNESIVSVCETSDCFENGGDK